MEKQMTMREAAELAGVCPRTLRRWIACGHLPARRTWPGRGGRLRIAASDLDRVLGRVVPVERS